MFAPWKKSYDKPRQHIKKQRHHFVIKGSYSQSHGFSSSHIWMWELDHKEAEHWRTDAFKLWCCRRLLRVSWSPRRSNQSTLKEISPEYSLEGLMLKLKLLYFGHLMLRAAAAKSLQSCPTLCDPINGSPPGSTIPEILQARTLEWVAISFSSSWKWKVKLKSLSHVQLFSTPWTAAYQAPPPMGFSRQEYWSGLPLPSPVKSWVIGKDPDAGKDWRREEKGTTKDEMVGWASPTQWTWIWASSGSWWWTGRLACCSPWGHKDLDTTEQLNWMINHYVII